MYGSQKDDNDRYDDGNDEIGPRWPRYLVLPTIFLEDLLAISDQASNGRVDIFSVFQFFNIIDQFLPTETR